MKKLLSLVVAGGLLVGSAAMASAADIKVKGQFEFGFGLYDGTNFQQHDGEESFDALQRFRTQIDVIASESLKGVLALEIGNTNWGDGGSTWGLAGANNRGGGMGADGVIVELKQMYLDWLVPNTDLQVRMGIQPFATPRAVVRSDGEDGGFLLDDDMAGILLSYNFNENFGANLGWFRGWDGYVNDPGNSAMGNEIDDEVDIFLLSLPIEVKDTFSVTPYGVYALIGDDLGADIGTYLPDVLSAHGTLGDEGDAWWAGVAFDLSYFDPFVAAIDLVYGKYDADNVGGVDPDRDGWAVIGKFGYKLDYFTPILFGWYGSGSDDLGQDGLDGILPYLSADWGLTSFGWSNAHFGGREYMVGDSPAGTWAIGLGLEDIKFIDNLTSHLRVMYFEGTSDSKGQNTFETMRVLNDDDSGFEVNLDNVINVYDNLDMYVELAYINLDIKHDTNAFEDDAWKGYVGFSYSF